MNRPRYELQPVGVFHPWRMVHRNGKTSPRVVDGVRLVDRETGATLSEGMRARVPHSEVRTLNGYAALTPARVVGILRKAGHRIGTWNASSMVRGWGSYTSGARVRFDEYGRIAVDEVAGNFAKHDPEGDAAKIAAYMETLAAAGVDCLGYDDARRVAYF